MKVKLTLKNIVLISSGLFILLLILGISILAIANKKPTAAFYGISERNVERISSVLQTTHTRKNKKQNAFNIVVLDSNLSLEEALKKQKRPDIIFMYNGKNADFAEIRSVKKKINFDKKILEGMSSSVIKTVSANKSKIHKVPLLIDNCEIDINRNAIAKSKTKQIAVLSDVEKFATELKKDYLAPIVFAGADNYEFINFLGAMTESISGIDTLKRAANKINDFIKSGNTNHSEFNKLLSQMVAVDGEFYETVEVLRKWYKEKLIPSNVYKMTSRDVKSYMEQKLCGISVLTLSEHRTVKQSTIEEFTSIYYPSIFANVERTFSAPIIMAIPYSKNKIAMNSIKKLATVEYQERLSIKTGLAPVQKNCAIPDRQADDVRYWVAASEVPFVGLSEAAFTDAKTRKMFADILRMYLQQ